jgi:cation diffusion facilitator family transporter
MQSQTLTRWQHDHDFLGARHGIHERRTWLVVALTAVMMVAEIGGGTLFGSMALVADGLHMSTHVAAMSIAAFAYSFARRHVDDEWFSFGTGKLGELAAFASAIILAMVALLIGYESAMRFVYPVEIRFAEAIPIAALALGVNLLSAFLLHDHGPGTEDHDNAAEIDHDAADGAHAHHVHDHDHHADHNIRAAYLHVMADVFTSVLAISTLAAGAYFGIGWLDPVAGLVGAGVIGVWVYSLVKSSAAVLLDAVAGRSRAALIRQRLEFDGDRVADLHLWRLGPGHLGVIAVMVTNRPRSPDDYKSQLTGIDGLSHINIEVNVVVGLGPDQRAA